MQYFEKLLQLKPYHAVIVYLTQLMVLLYPGLQADLTVSKPCEWASLASGKRVNLAWPSLFAFNQGWRRAKKQMGSAASCLAMRGIRRHGKPAATGGLAAPQLSASSNLGELQHQGLCENSDAKADGRKRWPEEQVMQCDDYR